MGSPNVFHQGILNEIQEIINEEQGLKKGPALPNAVAKQQLNMLDQKETTPSQVKPEKEIQSLPKEENKQLIQCMNSNGDMHGGKEEKDSEKSKNLFYM